MSFLYQRSGLKARVYSSAIIPPVKLIDSVALWSHLGLSQAPRRASEFVILPESEKIEAGPMPREDQIAMTELLSGGDFKSIMEFGTNWGTTTALFLLKTEARIWTLDICREMLDSKGLADKELKMTLPREKVGWIYRQSAEYEKRVTQVFQDSMTLDWKRGDWPPAFDLIFVDACHEYEFVKVDTQNAVEKLAPGGLLIWHDFYSDVSSWTGVFRAVSEFAKEHPGVVNLQKTHLAAWRKPAIPIAGKRASEP